MAKRLLGRPEPAGPNRTWVTLLFEPRDCWIGLYWTHNVEGWDGGWWESWRFSLTIIPMLPIRINIDRSNKPTRAYKRWLKEAA